MKHERKVYNIRVWPWTLWYKCWNERHNKRKRRAWNVTCEVNKYDLKLKYYSVDFNLIKDNIVTKTYATKTYKRKIPYSIISINWNAYYILNNWKELKTYKVEKIVGSQKVHKTWRREYKRWTCR